MATGRRIQRINKTLMKEISEVIMREVKDPRVLSLVSIVNADMASDMRSAKILVSIFGKNELDNLKTLEALNSAAGFISSIVSRGLRLPHTPHITFERTNSIELGVSMNVKLKELLEDEKQVHGD
jgi:ribosome-binding factor A